MIIVLLGNLVLAGFLLANDFITVYFPRIEIGDHMLFYLVTFGMFLLFCQCCLGYLLWIVWRRVRPRKQGEGFHKSKASVLVRTKLVVPEENRTLCVRFSSGTTSFVRDSLIKFYMMKAKTSCILFRSTISPHLHQLMIQESYVLYQ